ncbi:MAG: mechanosensitive ion channel family protein [Candidatus Acidiferrales bacterium]
MDGLWQRAVVDPLVRLWEQTLNYLPSLLEALVVLAAGWLAAMVVKQVVWRGLRAVQFDRLAERMGFAGVIDRVGFYRGSSFAVAQLAQGFLLLLTFLLVLNALGPSGSDLVMRFFLYLPNLFIATVILVVGGMAASFFGRGALIAAVNARLESARLLAGAVRAFIWMLAIIVALEHIGIGRTTVLITFGVLFGGLITAVAVAFGLAGKELAREALEGLLKRRAREEEEEEGVRHL